MAANLFDWIFRVLKQHIARMNKCYLTTLLLSLPAVAVTFGQVKIQPLSRGHAHNDYAHERPLLDALEHGFCSVEADIYLVEGHLLVAHDRGQVQPGRTLQALYLDPLRDRVQKNGGKV